MPTQPTSTPASVRTHYVVGLDVYRDTIAACVYDADTAVVAAKHPFSERCFTMI